MGTNRRIACLCMALSFPLAAQERQDAAELGPLVEPPRPADASDAGPVTDIDPNLDIVESDGADPPEATYSEEIDLSASEGSDTVSKAMRVTLSHEASYRMAARGVVNNRSAFRLEYSKFFLDSFFVQIDSKVNAFWGNDHRAEAENKRVLFETNTPEAFLQYSRTGGDTSVKVGVQKLIWGESEGGAITDEVSPRNLSELFFIPLDESRIGQFIVNVDHFVPIGDWSFFFIPNPKFNRYPRRGTAYDFDPFDGLADVRDDRANRRDDEYGMRWRKTFGQADVSFMAASLIDNDYAFRADGVNDGGRLLVSRVKQRFSLTGATFSYTRGDYLLKSEVGYKSAKAFNDAAFQIIERDVIDSSLGLTYSLGKSNTVGLEVVNSYVRDWNDEIASVRRNTTSFVLNKNFFFFNDNLSVNWLTIYSRPFSSIQSSIRTSYKWNDNTTFSLDAHMIDVPDRNSALHRFRDQDQIVFKVQYQF